MKYSRQRELVYSAVMEKHIHPTAEDIYKRLKIDNPNLSLGTVYRNLQTLSDKGSIKKLSFPDKPDKYDGNKTQHYHGICIKCGEVVDIYLDYLKEIDRSAELKLACPVLSHSIVFDVICPECAGNKSANG